MGPHVDKGDQTGTNPIYTLDSRSSKSLLVAFANVLIIAFCAGSQKVKNYFPRYGGHHIFSDSCFLQRILSKAEDRSPSFTESAYF